MAPTHDLVGLTREYEAGVIEAYTTVYAGGASRARPAHAGAVYGPSELETAVRIEPRARSATLSRLPDFQVAEGDPDPRGWPVIGAAGGGRYSQGGLPVGRRFGSGSCTVGTPARGPDPRYLWSSS
ncbi:MAG: hypothetical protein HY703_01000 [Gemmatimonadetes bacterium]|nr:hypothetical protein [Gemmatimonadota bacterium]